MWLAFCLLDDADMAPLDGKRKQQNKEPKNVYGLTGHINSLNLRNPILFKIRNKVEIMVLLIRNIILERKGTAQKTSS